MEKVLILHGGAAHAMAIAECLKKSGYTVGVICDDKDEYGYHTKFVDERYIGPDSHDAEYATFMFNFLKEHHFDVLIPTSDVTAEFMSFHKEELVKLDQERKEKEKKEREEETFLQAEAFGKAVKWQ